MSAIESLRQKLAALSDLRMQLNANIPGTPFVLRGGEQKEERLPGMRRWVDRGILEQAYAGLDAGRDPQDLIDEAESSGAVLQPLTGALVGGLGSRALSGALGHKAPLTDSLVAALAGGVAGSAYHALKARKRREDMQEAIIGAQGDIQRNPRPVSALPSVNSRSTAAASTPMLLGTGPAVH